jgi:hypothetical protein
MKVDSMSAPGNSNENKSNGGTFGEMISNLKTPAVKNMEAAWSRAGASNHHTPAIATKLGSQDQLSASGSAGVGSKKFSDSIGDQRQEVSGHLETRAVV